MPWPLFNIIIAGAKYFDDPHNLYVFPLSNTFAKQKSVNFKYPFVFINRFSGFKLRYIIFFLSKYVNIVMM